MKNEKSIVNYFDGLTNWKEELLFLRDICLETNLDESLKWGIPNYSLNGKNIVGLAGFKNHFAMWFHQGVYLTDPNKLLINANPEATKGLRQLRFTSIKEIDYETISRFLNEAIDNEKKGKRIKVDQNKKVPTPIELETEFENNKKLQLAFNKLSPFKQKEYSEHIGSAKRESTRIARLEKCSPLIIEGIGLHDKYRK